MFTQLNMRHISRADAPGASNEEESLSYQAVSGFSVLDLMLSQEANTFTSQLSYDLLFTVTEGMGPWCMAPGLDS